MPDFSSRVLRQELLDEGREPDEEVHRNLWDIRRLNRLFGGRRLLLDALAGEVARHGLRRFSVLDIATGSADLPLAILEWAERRSLETQVFALDYRHRHLALFRHEVTSHPSLHPFCADAFRAPVPDHCFDFVTCCHFFHHLAEDQAVELLREMSRWGRRALIVSDLERHPLPYYFFRLASPFLSTSYMTRTDGALSIAQSFRKEEMEQIAARAGLGTAAVEWRWPFRLLLVADLPSAPENGPSAGRNASEA